MRKVSDLAPEEFVAGAILWKPTTDIYYTVQAVQQGRFGLQLDLWDHHYRLVHPSMEVETLHGWRLVSAPMPPRQKESL